MAWINLTGVEEVNSINAYALDADADINNVPEDVQEFAAPGSVAVSIESGDKWGLKTTGEWQKVGG